MKVMVIPDQHQRYKEFDKLLDKWPEDADKVVFLGDLMDDWESKEWWSDAKHNPIALIKKLTELKHKYGDKFVWLVGNHDLAYFPSNSTREERAQFSISGHQTGHHTEISEAWVQAKGNYQIAAEIDGVIYTHAGLTGEFVNVRVNRFVKHTEVESSTLVDKLNWLGNNNALVHTVFDHCSLSPEGDDTSEGCLWVRPNSLILDMAYNKQVVGHTEAGLLLVKNGKSRELLVVDSPEHDKVVKIIDGNLHVEDVRELRVTNKQLAEVKEWRAKRAKLMLKYF